MKTMTWEEIDKDWSGLQKRHRMEVAQAVARYCVGHKMEEIGERLGYSKPWVHTQLDYAGIGAAIGEKGNSLLPLTGTSDNVSRQEVPRLVSEFGPSVKAAIGRGGGSVHITGDDSEAFEAYVDHYINEGHEPAAATRLAKAEWAGEAAVEAGVIKETKNKRDETVNQILFPKDSKDSFELDLKMHMARVESAAKFLAEAKIRNLRHQSTCARVAKADRAWRDQAELILQHYQPS